LKQNLVIKIGTNILTTKSGELDLNRLRSFIFQICQIKKKTKSNIIVISSGSMTCGSQKLKLDTDSIPNRQASASVGQILLMNEYAKFFGIESITVGQLLLTKDCFTNALKSKNITNTVKTLWKIGVIPIVNENDTVTTSEIDKNFDDNDDLSSRVAILLDASKLIILTDTDGVYTSNPKIDKTATQIKTITEITPKTLKIIKDKKSMRSRGGMKSKLLSAKKAFDKNIPVVIAKGSDDTVLLDIINGVPRGTLIAKEKEQL
jgi:glutamate 5-kinase